MTNYKFTPDKEPEKEKSTDTQLKASARKTLQRKQARLEVLKSISARRKGLRKK